MCFYSLAYTFQNLRLPLFMIKILSRTFTFSDRVDFLMILVGLLRSISRFFRAFTFQGHGDFFISLALFTFVRLSIFYFLGSFLLLVRPVILFSLELYFLLASFQRSTSYTFHQNHGNTFKNIYTQPHPLHSLTL